MLRPLSYGPLSDSDTAALLGELLGADPSVGEVAAAVAERAAGNPFFAEEMVRELVQRGVLPASAVDTFVRRMRPSSGAGDGAGGHRGAHRRLNARPSGR